tara:strand:- start:250 stop:555 length:306 start_codon:yes stop_codon:yes gene_type:complete
MKIITNNQYRTILSFFELSTKEQNERSSYYDTIEESSFFRYRGLVYDLGDFMRVREYTYDDAVTNHEMQKWDGYHNDSFFSSVLVKYSECNDAVKVGLALS